VTRGRLLFGVALGLVVAGTAAGIVLAVKGSEPSRLSRAAYVRRANEVCESYGKRLDRIPPPLDPASPGAVYESIGKALPLLETQATEIEALRPPEDLQSTVDRFFVLTRRSLRHLRRARGQAGRRELFPMVQSLTAFGNARDAAKRYGRTIGFRC
jgi:hypothetical protein